MGLIQKHRGFNQLTKLVVFNEICDIEAEPLLDLQMKLALELNPEDICFYLNKLLSKDDQKVAQFFKQVQMAPITSGTLFKTYANISVWFYKHDF